MLHGSTERRYPFLWIEKRMHNGSKDVREGVAGDSVIKGNGTKTVQCLRDIRNNKVTIISPSYALQGTSWLCSD